MIKEEKDVDMLHSWIEVEGHPACPEEEAKELLVEVSKFLCLFFPSHLPLSIPGWSICYPFFPHNLDVQIVIGYFLLFCRVWVSSNWQAWRGRRWKDWKQRAQQLEAEGWGETKGGRNGIWGGGFLWTLERSHLVFSPSSFTTSTVPIPSKPQFLSYPTVSSRVHRTWSLRSYRPSHGVHSSSCHSSSWGWHTSWYATSQDSTGGCQASVSVPSWRLQGGPN